MLTPSKLLLSPMLNLSLNTIKEVSESSGNDP